MASLHPNVRIVVNALERFATDKVKKIVLDCTANLIEDTPRDTGWCRNNWIPEIGPGGDDPIGSRNEGGVTAARAAQQQGIATIALSYKLGLGVITISNNVPYVTILNEGSSTQAPAGFVQAAILKAVESAGRLIG